MGLDKFPFTSYDFWAYLASGFLLLGAIDYVCATNLLVQKEWSWLQIGVAVSCTYITGQLIASLSSTVFEAALVGKALGWPRDILFGQTKMHRAIRWCLAGYYEPLSIETQKAALEKGKAVGVDGPGEKLFVPAYVAAKSNAKVMERLSSFLNLYGFSRNVALVAYIDAALFGWSYNWRDGPPLHGNLGWVSLAVGIGMTLRYLKFFRLFSVEVFTSYAFAKDSKDKEGK
jgi:hypothetical protein